ncbi:hypothetical protein [Brachybacterium hainanense]|uniref:Uncharacterized protein n=1 Tax=Brachybacterium hainanense TaxID=1541174 RepID=A0ABV6RE54_9MICO
MSRARRSTPASAVAQSTRVFGPPAPAVIGTLLAAVVFVIVLEFLVLISFIGQRLWGDPRILHDAVFSLPLLGWVAVAAASVVLVARILTTWLQLTEHGMAVRGLFRRAVDVPWGEVSRVLAVHRIDRGATPAEMLDLPDAPYDGVFVIDREGHRLVNVSGRFFGIGAQHAMVERARAAGVEIQQIEEITPRALRERERHAQTWIDLHPNLVLATLIGFYLAHNIATFAIWGL